MTGEQIRHLMRAHKKTIRGLAAQMGITQKRVREVRYRGVTEGRLWVRDWVQAITGVDPWTELPKLEEPQCQQ